MTGFSTAVHDSLSAPLARERVAHRDQSGVNLSYLEGYDVINTANRIFGFGGWSLSVERVDFLSGVGDNGAYMALVSVAVRTEGGRTVQRSDVGTGLVQGRAPARPEAHEVAQKAAVTDAMKRAFRTFGDQFGNGLYDKDSEYHKAASGPVAASGRATGGTSRPAQPNGPAADGDALVCLVTGKPGSEWRKVPKKDGGFWTPLQRARFNEKDTGLFPVSDEGKRIMRDDPSRDPRNAGGDDLDVPF